MNIDMISPRAVYYRKPHGRHYYEKNYKPKSTNGFLKSAGGTQQNEFSTVYMHLNQELELYCNGNFAVLHSFSSQDKNLLFSCSTDSEIKCAAFVSLSQKLCSNASMETIFDDKTIGQATGIVLFTDSIAKYYGFNGEIRSCKLPCKVSNAWKIKSCLLVEREEYPLFSDLSPHSLFVMTHTTSEFTPVVLRDENGCRGFVHDTRFRIISVNEEQQLVIAYDCLDECFSLWRVRDAVKDDYVDLYNQHWDGSITTKTTKLQLRSMNFDLLSHSSGVHHMRSSVDLIDTSSNVLHISKINRSIDDLDERSPLVRSLKSTLDVNDSGITHQQIMDGAASRQSLGKLLFGRRIATNEPLFPKICLDFLYKFKPLFCDIFNPTHLIKHSSTPMNNGRQMTSNSKNDKRVSTFQQQPPSTGFFAEDFYNRTYICLSKTIKDCNFFQIIKFQYDNSTKFLYSVEKNMRIIDAVYLDRLKFIVILELSSSLSLYIGSTPMCKISLLNAIIYQPDFFNNDGMEIATSEINSIICLSEPTNYGFTLHTKSNLAIRLYLPEMTRFHLVKKCLTTLKQLLPLNVGTALFTRWYSLNRAVDSNEGTSVEWSRFVDFILENIGFRKECQQNDNSIIRTVKDLCLNNINVVSNDNSNSDEICSNKKKSKSNFGIYSTISDHLFSRDRLADFSSLASNICDQMLLQYAHTVLFSLHLVYESEKVNFSSASNYLETLGILNCSLAFSLEAVNYVEYYVTEQPDIWLKINRLPSIANFFIDDYSNGDYSVWNSNPPNWGLWFSTVVNSGNQQQMVGSPYPIIDELNGSLITLMKIWLVIFRNRELLANVTEELNLHFHRYKLDDNGLPCHTNYDLISRFTDIRSAIDKNILSIENIHERTTSYFGEIHFLHNDFDQINSCLSIVFRILCYPSNHCPTSSIQPALYNLFGRSDLEKQRNLIGPLLIDSGNKRSPGNSCLSIFNELYSFNDTRKNCHLYWSSTVKSHEKISVRSHRLKINNPLDEHQLYAICDADPIVQLAYPDKRIKEAYKMLQSCCAVELDATIYHTYTIDESDSPSEALKSELESHLKLINTQRTFALPIGRGMLGLQIINSQFLKDTIYVPPLCLNGKYFLSGSNKPHIIENNTSGKWPSFHNGVAAGLMISSYNDNIDPSWILQQCNIRQQNDKIELTAEQAGVMFGLGLNGHLNKLDKTTIGRALKSLNDMTTMAFLIGLCAFNMGSKNSLLMSYISLHYRRLLPDDRDNSNQISSLSQVASIISAGLLNFASGNRQMARFFIEEIGRSREQLLAEGIVCPDIELTATTAGFSVGLIMFQHGEMYSQLDDSDELIRLLRYLKGGYQFPVSENDPDINRDAQKCVLKNYDPKKPQIISKSINFHSFQTTNSRVQEGECYNSDITSPGAAVALGMIFMASDNETIASELKCPNTFYLLEDIRPPVLCFRQIAYGMIMWNNIQPTQHWVDSIIPQFISSKALQAQPSDILEKYIPTANESYLQLLVGSCFVMAMRYAGTDNIEGLETILVHIEKLQSLKNDCELLENIGRYFYDWALSTLFLSACMIASGTGNLKLLQMSRNLRSINRPKDTLNYGVYMTYSMSIGLLFLGGGKLTLSNTPKSAALLLISFFPRFPPTYSGNRYHLQALRHLYVVATRPRILCAVDIDYQIAVSISSIVKFKNGVRESHGCVVFPREHPGVIDEIEVFDPKGEYFTQIYKPGTESWNVLRESLYSGGYFFVKKKCSVIPLKDSDSYHLLRIVNGYQMKDFSLLSDFFFSRHCTTECPWATDEFMKINSRIMEFIVNNKQNLQQTLNRISTIPNWSFVELVSFYDWCLSADGQLLRVWSLFSAYIGVTVETTRIIRYSNSSNSQILNLANFLLKEILQ